MKEILQNLHASGYSTLLPGQTLFARSEKVTWRDQEDKKAQRVLERLKAKHGLGPFTIKSIGLDASHAHPQSLKVSSPEKPRRHFTLSGTWFRRPVHH